MLDYRIDNALIFDGSGAPARSGSIGIRQGRIVSEPAGETASEVVNAEGLALSPGFIELHTHMDAQLFWDPWASPLLSNGITTAIAGNCGFTLAPASADAGDVDFLARLMARVEGMPLDLLEAEVPWGWSDHAGYAAKLSGRVALNVGFLAGHSTIRRAVMGEAASEREASELELEQMVALLGRMIEQGAVGFSTSFAQPHHDGDGRPIPSAFASRAETLALCAEAGRHPGTFLELAPVQGRFSEETRDFIVEMSVAARRPLNWNLLVPGSSPQELYEHQLSAFDHARAGGGEVFALTMPIPMVIRSSFNSGFVLDSLPGWEDLFLVHSDARIAMLRDPAVRARMQDSLAGVQGIMKSATDFGELVVTDTYTPETAPMKGRRIAEIAAERGQTPLDAMLDIVVSDRLRTGLQRPEAGNSDKAWADLARSWLDPRTVVGGSDAGAHIDALYAANYPLVMIAEARKRNLAPLEKVIQAITDSPARKFGLRERGRIADGWHADLVLFDPEAVASGPVGTVEDLPGGNPRLMSEARGIHRVFVNGSCVIDQGSPTGNMPGLVLQSGKDTETVDTTRHQGENHA